MINFEDLQEGDEKEEKFEMWFPSASAGIYAWPGATSVNEDFWDTLSLGLRMTKEQKDELVALLKRFPYVVPDNDGKLGHWLVGEHCIKTGKQRLHKFPHLGTGRDRQASNRNAANGRNP